MKHFGHRQTCNPTKSNVPTLLSLPGQRKSLWGLLMGAGFAHAQSSRFTISVETTPTVVLGTPSSTASSAPAPENQGCAYQSNWGFQSTSVMFPSYRNNFQQDHKVSARITAGRFTTVTSHGETVPYPLYSRWLLKSRADFFHES